MDGWLDGLQTLGLKPLVQLQLDPAFSASALPLNPVPVKIVRLLFICVMCLLTQNRGPINFFLFYQACAATAGRGAAGLIC